jgi:single-stranded-DNA-specific exonuclease
VPAPIEAALREAGLHPVIARLYAARGIREAREAQDDLSGLIAPAELLNAQAAACLLAEAIAAGQRLLIVADYDCDGATACAVGMRALRAMGATVDFIVPDRFTLGYGLTPELVALCASRKPDLLITVDNGIASVAGVAEANARGIATLITDHHLPGDALPAASCIVNPNQPGCSFPSKALAGVGVMFYVMLALRAELRRRGAYPADGGPALADLLPLVALGTVADVVPLDRNNRILVSQGLRRIRSGKVPCGIRALFAAAGREPSRASTFDLGFGLGPRLNAAGRLADMSAGIQCLITDDPSAAWSLAESLDRLNNERRRIEAEMQAEAERLLPEVLAEDRASITLFDASFHQGVIGILAGRIKERLNRPTFVFAPGGNPAAADELRGSGRSIEGLHLRDCLDLMSKIDPRLLLRFGGHAAAAGVSLSRERLADFERHFESLSGRLLGPGALQRTLQTDGALEPAYMTLECARLIAAGIWGQGFPAPLFMNEVEVLSQQLVKDRHLRLRLRAAERTLEAIQFNSTRVLPKRARVAYRLSVNSYNGMESAQLVVEHWEPLSPAAGGAA